MKYRTLKDKKILIIEDDPNSLLLIHDILEKIQVQMLTANDGQQAMEIISKEESIDLILLDIQIPIKSGFEVAKFIRSKMPNTIIIAQTAHALENDKDKCIKAGCNDYLAKPFKESDVLDIIDKWI